ncbi:hypothetical protein [Ruminococcus sp.]|uniref:hypothetical protein n=1 Tax=Ruminococcus sp. TaxID=41978 RepID=UPI002D176531|nr:hypothetical protein [Ruminococcus sp.]HOA00569.1 hypothetical protein [Ruminococcus sp.]HOH88408.1 hypothetical protein [Ruminococcus sp.]
MKNMIKKIAAIAMAFTLIGTGTAATKIISPRSVNTLTASAARNTKAYRVKCRFALPISFSYADALLTNTSLDHAVSGGGNFVLNLTIYEGTVLELDSKGKCVSGYNAKTGKNLKGADFSRFMHNMQRLY